MQYVPHLILGLTAMFIGWLVLPMPPILQRNPLPTRILLYERLILLRLKNGSAELRELVRLCGRSKEDTIFALARLVKRNAVHCLTLRGPPDPLDTRYAITVDGQAELRKLGARIAHKRKK